MEKNSWVNFLLYSLLIVGILSLPILYVGRNVKSFYAPSGSMIPTLQMGDKVAVDMAAYKKHAPGRGDVVVYEMPEEVGKMQIKRIVGLPNETVEIKDGKILIDGLIVNEPISIKNCYYYNGGDYAREGRAVKIPDDCYFVLGDNSCNARDSRYWGFLPRNNIFGKVFKIYFPFNRFRDVK